MPPSSTILITGATAGIGRHAALHFARRGDRVIATGRNPKALDDLAAEAARIPGVARFDTLRLDVTDRASIAALAPAVDRLTDGRGVDVLVNNAGYGLAGALAEVTEEDLRLQFETNVFGLMAVTRALLPRMIERRRGRILNLSSVGGRVTFPMFGAYHGSKYAVEALSDALRLELRPLGIEVVLIEPGPIRSEFANRSIETVAKYRAAASPYAPIYAQVDAIEARAAAMAIGPEATSRAMERAITARRPQARYVVPGRMRLVIFALRALPTRLADWLLSAAIGLPRIRPLASSAAVDKPSLRPAA